MDVGTIVVRADWDPEAKVYVATSEDVPGLVAEAASPNELVEKLNVLIPELLNLNAGVAHESSGADTSDRTWKDVPMVVLSQQISKVRIHS